MLSLLKPHLLLFAVAIQIALLGLLVDNLQGDTITSNQLSNYLSGRSATIGHQMPYFKAYDATYLSQSFPTQGRPSMVIFSSCDCQLARIRDWSVAASSHGEDVSVIFLKRPKELNSLKQASRPLGKILAVRQTELGTNVGMTDFPIGFHLSADGAVISIQR